MRNIDKISDKNQIDIEELSSFLSEYNDNNLLLLIKEKFVVSKKRITKDIFQKYYKKIFENVKSKYRFVGDDFPVDYFNDEVINYILSLSNKANDNLIISFLNSDLDIYYSVCKKFVKNYFLNIIYINKNYERYYDLLKIAYESQSSKFGGLGESSYKLIPKEYIPQLMKDFPEDKKLKDYLLKEYISKEIRKLLKEQFLKIKTI